MSKSYVAEWWDTWTTRWRAVGYDYIVTLEMSSIGVYPWIAVWLFEQNKHEPTDPPVRKVMHLHPGSTEWNYVAKFIDDDDLEWLESVSKFYDYVRSDDSIEVHLVDGPVRTLPTPT